MSTKTKEILDLLQEECGEVVVAVSKVRRFNQEHNRDQLVQELGDVLTLIDLLKSTYYVSEQELQKAKLIKSEKLRQFTTVYEI